MRRFRDPMVFLKFDTSAVFAGSPSHLCFGPKDTSDLEEPFSKKIRKKQ